MLCEKNMKARKFALVGRCAMVVAAFLLLGAGTAELEQNHIPQTSQAINEFTLALLKRLAANNQVPANTILSAQSVYHGLVMSYIASGGDTRAELARVCGYPADNQRLVAELAAIRRQLQDTAKHRRVEVSMANSVWLDETHADFRKDYVQNFQTAFDASLNGVRFADAKGASTQINRWVMEKTHGKIQQAVSPADFASRSRPGVVDEPALVTVNAVYFKADWGSRFDKSATRDLPFYRYSATTADARMMHQKSILPYSENERVQFLEIPYIDGLYSMYLFLPKSVIPVQELLGGLTVDAVLDLKRKAFGRDVDVLLPKFELRSHVGIKEQLYAMGVHAAFDNGKADFDRMIIKKAEAFRVYISEIYHDAWVDLHEEGTEAAAATSTIHFSFGCSAPSILLPAEFHADHPFVFLIVHNQSRSILFGGWVSDPNKLEQ
jgi:serpin B